MPLLQVRKYLGAYFTHLGGRVDAVVFSAGKHEGWLGLAGVAWLDSKAVAVLPLEFT